MSKFALPRAAVAAELPRQVRLQIVSSGAGPPSGEGWLQEIKSDAPAARDSLLADDSHAR
jgi:hypothetical protein